MVSEFLSLTVCKCVCISYKFVTSKIRNILSRDAADKKPLIFCFLLTFAHLILKPDNLTYNSPIVIYSITFLFLDSILAKKPEETAQMAAPSI